MKEIESILAIVFLIMALTLVGLLLMPRPSEFASGLSTVAVR